MSMAWMQSKRSVETTIQTLRYSPKTIPINHKPTRKMPKAPANIDFLSQRLL
jgi:hypothetical protein